MRIIAGLHRGRVLKAPAGRDIRPTSDKVRQALFNALNSRGAVVDAVVLDAFCGTGALGFEALSQGASACVFMDIARSSVHLAQDNAAMLREVERCAFLHKDATAPGSRPETATPATLVFLDPPYHKNLVPQALSALQAGGWIAPGAMIVAETEKGADLSQIMAPQEFSKAYGDTEIRAFLV